MTERIKSSVDLAQQLKQTETIPPNDLAQVQKAVGRLMSTWPNNNGIYVQLQKLAEFISKTREELSTLRPDEVKASFIPKATDELDAIVEATASATNRIMDAADVIMNMSGRLAPADSTEAMAAVTSIYEACTFQDITGQRVTKVVNMLKVIESRIDKMVAALGEMDLSAANRTGAATPAATSIEGVNKSSQDDIDAMFGTTPPSSPGGSTLEGPALKGQGRSQDEIDALLAGKD